MVPKARTKKSEPKRDAKKKLRARATFDRSTYDMQCLETVLKKEKVFIVALLDGLKLIGVKYDRVIYITYFLTAKFVT